MRKVVCSIIIVIGLVLLYLITTGKVEIIKEKEYYNPIEGVIEEKDLPSKT